ncbi:MAG: tRNA-binding protein [Candidatus Kapabacteria bacterium]|nr:tRNA-binding protein [Candidatus Kapabacteria bacterium]
MEHASMEDFDRLDLRVGTIVRAEPFPEARKPAYKLWIDLGGGEMRRSSAQITDLYTPESLVGRQVVCVCGFAPKQIGPWMSEVLVTGFHLPDGSVALCVPDAPVTNGTKLR